MDPTGYLRLLCPRPYQVRELMPLTGNSLFSPATDPTFVPPPIWRGLLESLGCPKAVLWSSGLIYNSKSALVFFASHIRRLRLRCCA